MNLVIRAYSAFGQASVEVCDLSCEVPSERFVGHAACPVQTWDGAELAGFLESAIEGIRQIQDRLMM